MYTSICHRKTACVHTYILNEFSTQLTETSPNLFSLTYSGNLKWFTVTYENNLVLPTDCYKQFIPTSQWLEVRTLLDDSQEQLCTYLSTCALITACE